MNIDQFWVTIEASRSRTSATEPDGNMARQAEELRKLVSRLSPEEVSQLAAASLPEVEDFFFEEFPSVSEEVYEGMTGKEIPGYSGPRPKEPRGTKWEEGDLKRRFPKLWRKFG